MDGAHNLAYIGDLLSKNCGVYNPVIGTDLMDVLTDSCMSVMCLAPESARHIQIS